MIHQLPEIDDFSKVVALKSVEQTTQLAKRCAQLISGGEIILLWGSLGAGKTFFSQSFCNELGVSCEVVSPTFTIANVYDGDYTIYHLDFYRLESTDDLVDIGFEAMLEETENGNAVMLIEWPGPALSWLDKRVEIMIQPTSEPTHRKVYARGVPELRDDWLNLFQEK